MTSECLTDLKATESLLQNKGPLLEGLDFNPIFPSGVDNMILDLIHVYSSVHSGRTCVCREAHVGTDQREALSFGFALGQTSRPRF